MQVLMLGWEFPPLSSGGLGTACYGLTKGLSSQNVGITFVVPSAAGNHNHLKIIATDQLPGVKHITISSWLTPYLSASTVQHHASKQPWHKPKKMYGHGLFEEVYRYSEVVKELAKTEQFDIIHAHDWLTFEAGIKAKKVSGKPLVVHVHATEFDRTAGKPNHYVYTIEYKGLKAADRIIAVSNFTKNIIVEHYGISPDKIDVVHNAVDQTPAECVVPKLKQHSRVVLFLGRITIQKGPDYFLYAAKKVLDYEPNVTFVMAGTGDMEEFIIEKAAEMGIADKFLFTGFLTGAAVDRIYRMADLYVMPSVSEPFGITPLEAMKNGTPVLISKQSGVSEVISHCLKVDFWDVNELANKIISVLRYSPVKEALAENGSREVKKFNWEDSALKCLDTYNKVLARKVLA